jgi:DNA repair protein RadA/Sms
VRAVPQGPARLKEAGKLGFTRAVVPESGRSEASEGLAIHTVSALTALVAEIAARSPRAPRRAVGGAEDG